MRETRTLTEVLCHFLVLNPMRGYTEQSEAVAWSEDKEKLLTFYNSLKVEPYVDKGSPSFECHGSSHDWHKVFAKDSPLEWFNPMHDELTGAPNHRGQGIQSQWIPEDGLGYINGGIHIY